MRPLQALQLLRANMRCADGVYEYGGCVDMCNGSVYGLMGAQQGAQLLLQAAFALPIIA